MVGNPLKTYFDYINFIMVNNNQATQLNNLFITAVRAHVATLL